MSPALPTCALVIAQVPGAPAKSLVGTRRVFFRVAASQGQHAIVRIHLGTVNGRNRAAVCAKPLVFLGENNPSACRFFTHCVSSCPPRQVWVQRFGKGGVLRASEPFEA